MQQLAFIAAGLTLNGLCVEQVNYFCRNDYSLPHLGYFVILQVTIAIASISNAIDLLPNYYVAWLHSSYLLNRK
jgi:hypothetical protein